jgi:hypothetical protein
MTTSGAHDGNKRATYRGQVISQRNSPPVVTNLSVRWKLQKYIKYSTLFGMRRFCVLLWQTILFPQFPFYGKLSWGKERSLSALSLYRRRQKFVLVRDSMFTSENMFSSANISVSSLLSFTYWTLPSQQFIYVTPIDVNMYMSQVFRQAASELWSLMCHQLKSS